MYGYCVSAAIKTLLTYFSDVVMLCEEEPAFVGGFIVVCIDLLPSSRHRVVYCLARDVFTGATGGLVLGCNGGRCHFDQSERRSGIGCNRIGDGGADGRYHLLVDECHQWHNSFGIVEHAQSCNVKTSLVLQ